MKTKQFAEELCDYMEKRVVEICTKFAKGNVNMASLPAFWLGLSGDIQTFIKENKLEVSKRK